MLCQPLLRFCASSSRFRGEDFVSTESMSRRALAVISSTARLKGLFVRA
jgi:hypothetical protein